MKTEQHKNRTFHSMTSLPKNKTFLKDALQHNKKCFEEMGREIEELRKNCERLSEEMRPVLRHYETTKNNH